jgi:hypothetical protein
MTLAARYIWSIKKKEGTKKQKQKYFFWKSNETKRCFRDTTLIHNILEIVVTVKLLLFRIVGLVDILNHGMYPSPQHNRRSPSSRPLRVGSARKLRQKLLCAPSN